MPLAVIAVMAAFMTVTACNHKKKSKRPIIVSPSGDVRGGVDIVQTLALTPAADSRFKQNFVYQSDRKPVRVTIEQAYLVDVTKAACDDGICTIEYKQKEKTDSSPAAILYHLEDEQGEAWTQGRIFLKGQQPKIPANFAFTPRFKETVKISFPIADQYGAALEKAPELTALYGEGGNIVKASCTTTACEIEYFYKQQIYNPAVSFKFSIPEMVMPSDRISATPEVVKYLPSKKATFDGQTSASLIQGIDYISSWNRPASYIKVEATTGMAHPVFQCSETGCLANNVQFDLTKPVSMIYRVGAVQETGRVEWHVITPQITPFAKEAVVSNNVYTDIVFVPGTDYISAGDIPATTVEIDRSRYIPDLSFGPKSCDAAGTCKLSVYYSGAQPFVMLNYTLHSGTYQSPQQSLKVVPHTANTERDLEVWDDRTGPFTLELKPGRDYQTADGSKVTSVVIMDSAYGLKFTEAPVLDDNTRSQAFVCDEEGVCRATVTRTHDFTSEVPLRLKLVTPTSQGAILQKKVVFKRDAIAFTDANERISRFGEEVNASVDSFSVRLDRGQDYDSQFPAQTLDVTINASSGVSLANGNTINCDAQGSCVVEGRFTTDVGYVDLGLVLKNSYGASPKKTLRLIREKFAPFKPNLTRYALQETGSSQFEVVIARGDARGYNADEDASKMRVSAVKGFFVDDPQATDFTVACEEGACRLKIKATSFRDTFTYRMIDSDGKESIPSRVILEYPKLLAIDSKIQVPAEMKEINFELPATSDEKYTFETADGVTLETKDFNWVYDTIAVKAQLQQALVAGQELTIRYQIQLDDKVSNKGQLTLQAIPSLSLKKDLTVRAVPVTGAPETFTVVLKYSEHFNQLPAGTDPGTYFSYLYNARNLFDVKLDTASVLQTKPVSCDNYKLQCVYSFAKSAAGPLPAVKAELKGGTAERVSRPVLPGVFTIQFD
ncbi:hypothetical protein [Oligoflexus tunisiensis]|uniref:hypothetical protein n=1 Tax=Oligoflexus tunisiensis TaxID=708132 RepID=UPI001C401B1C|nr:hypothetical protein [Oligoflexus tunisiensis]